VRPLVLLRQSPVAIASPEHSGRLIILWFNLFRSPRQIVFRLTGFSSVTSHASCWPRRRSAEDRFAANDFADDVQKTANLEMKLAASGSRHSILVGKYRSAERTGSD